MEEIRLDILKMVSTGKMAIEEANTQLIALFDNDISLMSSNVEHGNSRWLDKFEDASSEAQREMEGYQWALNDISALYKAWN